MVEPVVFSFVWMNYLLQIPVQERKMDWAYDLCGTSLLLHIDVWANCFRIELVETEVIGLFEKALEALSKLQASDIEDHDPTLLKSYEDNIKDRLENIRNNYLEGKSSAFVPAARLKQLKALTLTNED